MIILKNKKKNYLYNYLLSSKKIIISLIFLIITGTYNQIYKFNIYKELTDTITNIDNKTIITTHTYVTTILYYLFGKLLFSHLYDTITNYLIKIMVIKTASNAFNDIIKKMIYYKIKFYDKYKKKDLMDICDSIDELTYITFEFILNFPQKIVYLIYYSYSIYSFSENILLIVIFINILILFLIQPIANKIDNNRIENLEKEKMLKAKFYETISNVPFIKTSSNEKKEIKKISQSYEDYYNKRKNTLKLTNLNEYITDIVNDILLFVVYLFGIKYILSDNIKSGDIIYIAIHIGNFHKKVLNIKKVKMYYNQIKPRLKLLEDIINFEQSEKNELDNINKKDISNKLKKNYNYNNCNIKIQFKNVSFSYSLNENILENINFKIYKNKINIIKGNNGCGKSTIIKLLMRMYELKEGNILYDNIDLNNISLQKLRKNIAYVTQEPTLFDNKLSYNLKYGLTRKEVHNNLAKMCEILGIYEWVKKNKDINIGFQGIQLSGGQKKKIQLVNMLSRNSEIIIFDEPTNNLDLETVTWFINNLDIIMSKFNKTIIIITHDKRLLKKADNIIYLKLDNKSS